MGKTPKEYAEELVEEYRSSILSFLSDKMKDENAKKCALIAVEKIVVAIDWHEFEVPNKQIEYFEQVKTEIENL